MNDSITDLGESLATAFRDKMTQWSALEFNFTADDLAASFGLEDDIMRLEEGWQAVAALVPTLPTDFLPQDLLAISNATAIPPEQPLPSPLIRKVENYPFKLPSETGFIGEHDDFLSGNELLPAENKAADDTNLPAPDSAPDFPEAKQISSSNRESGHFSFGFPENSVQPRVGNIPAVSATKILITPPEDKSDPVRSQGLPGIDGLNTLLAQGSPQTPAEETPNQPDSSSDSIWTQPLQNLGDFATWIVHPIIEESGKVKLPGQSQNAMAGTDPPSTELNVQAGDESAKLPDRKHRPGAPDPDFEMVPLPGRPEYLPPWVQTPDSKPEAQFFEQETNRNAPDTDDLLEALTDRILRDFHRYYP